MFCFLARKNIFPIHESSVVITAWQSWLFSFPLRCKIDKSSKWYVLVLLLKSIFLAEVLNWNAEKNRKQMWSRPSLGNTLTLFAITDSRNTWACLLRTEFERENRLFRAKSKEVPFLNPVCTARLTNVKSEAEGKKKRDWSRQHWRSTLSLEVPRGQVSSVVSLLCCAVRLSSWRKWLCSLLKPLKSIKKRRFNPFFGERQKIRCLSARNHRSLSILVRLTLPCFYSSHRRYCTLVFYFVSSEISFFDFYIYSSSSFARGSFSGLPRLEIHVFNVLV